MPSVTLRSAVRHGSNRSVWKLTARNPRSAASRCGSSLFTLTSPAVGAVCPMIMLRMVLFPAPVCPSSATISPWAIDKDRSATTVWPS